MSSSSALKASKSIVESYVSSSEKSDITTTFTEHSVSECENNNLSKNNIIKFLLDMVKHPKFKWALIAILLCIFVFLYFSSQNKKSDKKSYKKEDTRNSNIEIQKDKNGKPILVDKKEQELMNKITQMEQTEKELLNKINKMNTNNILNKQVQNTQQEIRTIQDTNREQQEETRRNQQEQEARIIQQEEVRRLQQVQQEEVRRMQQAQEVRRMQQAQEEARKMQKEQEVRRMEQQKQVKQLEEDTESSDEVFIENENVMVHNLTIDEMNAIDKQLEDININNMGYETD
jgi:hypothetical protein